MYQTWLFAPRILLCQRLVKWHSSLERNSLRFSFSAQPSQPTVTNKRSFFFRSIPLSLNESNATTHKATSLPWWTLWSILDARYVLNSSATLLTVGLSTIIQNSLIKKNRMRKCHFQEDNFSSIVSLEIKIRILEIWNLSIVDLSQCIYLHDIPVKSRGFSKVSSDRATMRVGRCRRNRLAEQFAFTRRFVRFFLIFSSLFRWSTQRNKEQRVARKWKTLPSCCRGLGKQGCALLVRKSSSRAFNATYTPHVSRFPFSHLLNLFFDQPPTRPLYIFYRILHTNL